MKRVMVRYKVKPERADENERFIKDVFVQLTRSRPSGLRYASFKLADGVTFVHLVSHEAADGSNPLKDMGAFQAFVTAIEDRCDEPPLATELQEVGSYRFFCD